MNSHMGLPEITMLKSLKMSNTMLKKAPNSIDKKKTDTDEVDVQLKRKTPYLKILENRLCFFEHEASEYDNEETVPSRNKSPVSRFILLI